MLDSIWFKLPPLVTVDNNLNKLSKFLWTSGSSAKVQAFPSL